MVDGQALPSVNRVERDPEGRVSMARFYRDGADKSILSILDSRRLRP
jgi:hypothetical protein